MDRSTITEIADEILTDDETYLLFQQMVERKVSDLEVTRRLAEIRRRAEEKILPPVLPDDPLARWGTDRKPTEVA